MKYYNNIDDVISDLDEIIGFTKGPNPLPLEILKDLSYRRIISRLMQCSSFIAARGRIGPSTICIICDEVFDILIPHLTKIDEVYYISDIRIIVDNRVESTIISMRVCDFSGYYFEMNHPELQIAWMELDIITSYMRSKIRNENIDKIIKFD